ncbi:phosphate ABC transporter substrate-binding protein [Aliivibrio fischeri]|uniref:phosphate ABC transporter substrate-binding protein n=1 Tax=Aliivibrio fischeri TaxID=668 RepID=UPI00080E1495|nr:phosphate ABC transporter substrate-binding protein [Aliivibrio fischeri]OCH10542.1 phosphate-binding protein [Aliivibrio fischeri]
MFKAFSYTSLFTALLFSSSTFAANTVIAGSTSVSTLLEPFIDEYNKDNKDNKDNKPLVDLQSIGSSAGIKLLVDDTVNLAISSRELTDKEKKSLSSTLIAYDAIAIVVHPDNPITELSTEIIWKIYHGDIKNWKELGGTDRKISVISREIASGSRFSFEKHFGLTQEINSFTVSDISDNALVVNGTGMVKSIVSRNPYAIGYVSAGTLGDIAQLRVLKVDSVLPSQEAIMENKYSLSHPFLFVYKNQTVSKESTEFMNYIASPEATKTIQSLGYIK